MDIADRMAEVAKVMKRTKEAWVAGNPDNVDLGIYVHFYRGDVLVAMALCPMDRDTALHAGHLGAIGFSADAMSVTFESYTSQLENSPVTGRPWMHQEMQYVFETNPRKGWVNECLTTTMHERGGRFGMCATAYEIKDHQVTWLEERFHLLDTDESAEGSGVMFEALQKAMGDRTINDVIDGQDDAMATLMANLIDDPEQRAYHQDMAVYKSLEERGLVLAMVFFAEPGSNRETWLNERLDLGDLKEFTVEST